MHAVGGRAEEARVDASGAAAMSADEMITCLGSCRARSELAAMIKALSLHPWLNTPAETKRLEAARAAMENTAKPGTTRAACASAAAETD